MSLLLEFRQMVWAFELKNIGSWQVGLVHIEPKFEPTHSNWFVKNKNQTEPIIRGLNPIQINLKNLGCFELYGSIIELFILLKFFYPFKSYLILQA